MNNGRTVGTVLAQPRTGILCLEQRLFAVEGLGVKTLCLGARACGDRIVEADEYEAEQEGDHHGG
jgi:hypothetical protein